MLQTKEEILIRKKIQEKGLEIGRHLCICKRKYMKENEYDEIVFNGNIYIKEKEHLKKVWRGDLNITKEGNKLKEIKKETGIELYVINEKEGKCKKEEKKIEWDTSKEIPIITEEEKNKREKEKKTEEERKEDERIKKEKDEKEINNKYKVEEINNIKGEKIIKIIKIPYDKIIRNKNRRIIEGTLINTIIEEEIRRIMERRIRMEKCWITEKTNNKLIELEKEISKKERREVIKGINIMNINEANKEKKNIKSYYEDSIYIIE